jgi:hypothetical protein
LPPACQNIRRSYLHGTILLKGLPVIDNIVVCDATTTATDLCECLREGQANFFARIGGSDTDFIAEYRYKSPMVGELRAIRALNDGLKKIMAFNGYYDKEANIANAIKYCDTMLDCYHECDQIFIVGHDLLTEFSPQSIHPAFRSEVSIRRSRLKSLCGSIAERQRGLRLYPYDFVEDFLNGRHTFLRTVFPLLAGKKILAVSPFSRSIRQNIHNKDSFFKGFKYPEFELITYNTPITYEGLPKDLYPDSNWNETAERLAAEISSLDFDIAMLACGSYSMPIGREICRAGKIAIYIGGCMQLFFGIIGRRYQNKFFTDQINLDKFITPVEWELYRAHVTVLENTHKDAFGAYF